MIRKIICFADHVIVRLLHDAEIPGWAWDLQYPDYEGMEDSYMLLDDTVVAPDQVFKENLIFPILSTPWKIYLLLTIGTETVRFGTLR